ncbi:S-adenosyl-L-methionine-dependent methyltransferase, partial [Gongronella butleri]
MGTAVSKIKRRSLRASKNKDLSANEDRHEHVPGSVVHFPRMTRPPPPTETQPHDEKEHAQNSTLFHTANSHFEAQKAPPPPQDSLDTLRRKSISKYSTQLAEGYPLLNHTKVTKIFHQKDGLQKESDRLQRQHYLLKRFLQGNHLVPLSNPSLIINWCCGNGIWCMEMAGEFPECKVVGMECRHIMYSKIPSALPNYEIRPIDTEANLSGFEEFDDNQVDMVTTRNVWLVVQPIAHWKLILKDVFRVLKPGGYFECMERGRAVHSAGPEFIYFLNLGTAVLEEAFDGQDINEHMVNFLHDVGFENVTWFEYKSPVGEWSDSLADKELGYLQKDLVSRRFLSMSDAVEHMIQINKDQLTDKFLKAMDECEEYKTFMTWHYFSAQKPLVPNSPSKS